jgi:hypothetical protein
VIWSSVPVRRIGHRKIYIESWRFQGNEAGHGSGHFGQTHSARSSDKALSESGWEMRLYCMFSACVAALAVATVATAGCDTEPDACVVPSGTYHIELPKSPAPDHPAILFLHGFGSSGAGPLRNRRLVDAVLRRGYAVIAPDGLPRPGRSRNGWSFHPQGLKQRDEVAFLRAVRDDAAQRYGLNPDNMLLLWNPLLLAANPNRA